MLNKFTPLFMRRGMTDKDNVRLTDLIRSLINQWKN
jgi:hypothetical protein